jgi:hypothetical protein
MKVNRMPIQYAFQVDDFSSKRPRGWCYYSITFVAHFKKVIMSRFGLGHCSQINVCHPIPKTERSSNL